MNEMQFRNGFVYKKKKLIFYNDSFDLNGKRRICNLLCVIFLLSTAIEKCTADKLIKLCEGF